MSAVAEQLSESACIALCLAHLGISATAAVTSGAIVCGICLAVRCLLSVPMADETPCHRLLIVALGCATALFSGNWHPLVTIGLLAGIVSALLSLPASRRLLRDAIPVAVLQATRIGLVLYGAVWLLSACGVIAQPDNGTYALSGLFEPETVDSAISLVALLTFLRLRVPAAPLLAILVGAAAGIPLGLTQMPSTLVALPDFDLVSEASGFLAVDLRNGARSVLSPVGLSVVALFAGSLALELDDSTDEKSLTGAFSSHACGLASAGTICLSALLGVPVPPQQQVVESEQSAVAKPTVALLVMAVTVAMVFFSPVVAQIPLTAAFGPLLAGLVCLPGKSALVLLSEDLSGLLLTLITVVGTLFGPSPACGFAIGLVTWTVVEVLSGKWRDIAPVTYLLAVLCGFFLVLLLG